MKRITRPFILFFIIAMFGCAPKYAYLSKDKIRKIKKIVVSIEGENDSLKIIDVYGTRNRLNVIDDIGYQLGGWGPLIAMPFSIAASEYKFAKAKGGVNTKSIASKISVNEVAQIILNGVTEAFNEKTGGCDYIDFDEVNYFTYDKGKAKEDHTHLQPDNIVEVKYKLGIGIGEEYTPQPAIAAEVKIEDPNTNTIIDKQNITADVKSFYDSREDIPSFEQYVENGADLFKKDLYRAAYKLGEKIARLYTYY